MKERRKNLLWRLMAVLLFMGMMLDIFSVTVLAQKNSVIRRESVTGDAVITINKENIAFNNVGETVQLKADVTPKEAVDSKVIWTSSDPEVAAVDENGKVTAVNNGTCMIKVTTADGNKTASCIVTVDIGVVGTPDETGIIVSRIKTRPSLNTRLKIRQKGKKINIVWKKVYGADGYDVYVQYCGRKFNKKSITAIKSGSETKITVRKINGKALNLKKNYKIYVLAYEWVDGEKVPLSKTITAHIAGKNNNKYTNVKAVKVKKSSYTIKKGRTARIKASAILVRRGKKQLSDAHAKEFRYATSSKNVATVSSKGKIKAVEIGECTIYVYARDGCVKKVKVKVEIG